MTRGFKKLLPENKAYSVARSCEFAVKGYLDGGSILLTLFLLITEASLEFVSMRPQNRQWIQNTITALLFGSLWLPRLFEFDFQEQCLSVAVILFSIFAHRMGKCSSQMLWQSTNDFNFLPRPRSFPTTVNKPADSKDLEMQTRKGV